MLYWKERWKAGGVLATVVLLGGLCGNGSAEPISPRALVEVVDFGPPVISADGRNVAFRVEQASIERNGYDSVWYVQAMDGSSPPRRVADGGTPLRDSAGNVLATPPVWSADGAWIYYRASMQGRIDVWRAAADGSRSQALTNDPADVRSFWLQADTSLLHYSVGGTRQQVRSAEQDEYDQGVSIDRYVPLGQGLVRSGMIEGRPTTQRFSGRWFQRVPLLAGVADQWKTLDLMTMQRRDAATAKVASGAAGTEAGRRSSSAQVIASARDPSRDWLAVIERVGGATSALAGTRLRVWMGAKAKRAIECPAEACHGKSIISLAWRPHSDELLFATSDPLRGHAHSLYRWNVRSAQVTHLASSRGHMANGSRYAPGFCAVSASALACVVAEADRPPRLEQIDIESGQRRILFDPNAGLAQQIAKTAPAQLLRWKDAEGTALNGWYFEAAGAHAAPAPLFISYYACQGFLRGGVGDEWPLASLASNGIAALCINQAENEDSDAAKRYDQGAAAVASAIDLLSGEGKADGNRIGMGGLSFGSEVTLWAAAHTRLLAAASVSSPTISPLYYLLASFKGDDFTNELNATWQLRGMDDTPDRWKVISPTFHLDTISAPILFQASEQEYLHSLDYAIPLMQRRRLDLYVFPDEPHIKFQPRHKLAVYERNIDWFRFWLQGIEDPAPGKEGQYAKWRQMPSANGGR